MKKFIGAVFLFLFPFISEAHIGYVLSKEEIVKGSGYDASFILSALQNRFNIFLILGTLVVVILIGVFWKKVNFLKTEIQNINKHLVSYDEFVPWILRLSLGIALIGAGTAQVLISPSLPGFIAFSTLQVLLGFLLMAGFLLPVVLPLVIALGLYALSLKMYFIGNLDFLASALALYILAGPKPGVDHILGIPFFSPLTKLKKFVPLVLRMGIGVAMMYLAVFEKFLNPHLSEMVVQNFQLTNVINVSPAMWVVGAGAVEFLVAFLLCVGLLTRLVSTIAFVVLSLSFFYFGEDVYSHITLFGLLSVLFITGGGKWSIDNLIRKQK